MSALFCTPPAPPFSMSLTTLLCSSMLRTFCCWMQPCYNSTSLLLNARVERQKETLCTSDYCHHLHFPGQQFTQLPATVRWLAFFRTRRWLNFQNSLLLEKLCWNWWLAMSYPRYKLLCISYKARHKITCIMGNQSVPLNVWHYSWAVTLTNVIKTEFNCNFTYLYIKTC
jgi:hypothetical protein